MSMNHSDTLPESYAIPGRISAGTPCGNLPTVQLQAPGGSAQLCLYGGQLLDYQPIGQSPVLWVSRHARFDHGQTIRGGIPICWPWFAKETDDPSRPMHGIARTRPWQPIHSHADELRTQLTLQQRDSAETGFIWPHPFELELTITLSDSLEITLIHRNTDSQPVRCTGALHTYFAVSHIDNIRIEGLDNTTYVDKVDDQKIKTQTGPVTIHSHTDRIYTPTHNRCTLIDGKHRQIQIDSTGSRSTVIWNPWIEKAKALADCGDDEYQQMICIESANAHHDIVTIEPGGQHRLGTKIISQYL